MLTALTAENPAVMHTQDAITAILQANMAGPRALQDSFATVCQGLIDADGEQGHLATWAAGQHTLQETAAEIQRLQEVGGWWGKSVIMYE